MPSMPIPTDWDGKSWECYTIQWPKSVYYRSILVGLIYSLTRGRTYDEQTGDVKSAQAIGWQVFNRNQPLVICGASGLSDVEGLTDAGNIGVGCYDGDFCDCDGDCIDMAGNCCPQLRWFNGKLQILNCGTWQDVPGSAGSLVDSDDPSTNPSAPPDTPEGQASFACAKATAYATLLYDVMTKIWEHRGDAPWAILKNIQNAVGVDLNDNRIFAALILIGEAEISQIDLTDIWTETPLAEAICRLAPKIDGTTSELTNGDEDRIVGMRDWLSNDLLEYSYIDQCIDAIGRDDFDKAGRLACKDPNFDCACPEVVPPLTIPVSYSWAHDYDFTQADYGWLPMAPASHITRSEQDGWKAVMDAPFRHTQDLVKPTNIIDGELYLKFIYLEMEWPAAYPAGENWANVDLVANGGVSPAVKIGGWLNAPVISAVVNVRIPSGTSNQLHVFTGQTGGTGFAPGSAFKIKRMVIAGVGVDPWASDPDFTG